MTYKKLGKIPIADLMLSLKQKAPDLFEEIAPHMNWSDGTARISQSLAQKLDDWLVAQESPYIDPHHAEMAEIRVRENKRIREERDHKAALVRLQKYADEQGLAETEKNTALVKDWIDASYAKGYWSPGNVDAAISFLGPRGSNILQWRPKVVAPPPVATPKPWKPGDPLPDNATVAQLHAASVEEVEWKRRKQGKDGR